MTGFLVRRMRVRGKSSYDRDGCDQHAAWTPLPLLPADLTTKPSREQHRQALLCDFWWLLGTSSTLVPGRAHVQCSGVTDYCEPLM